MWGEQVSKIQKLKEKFYSKPVRNDITFQEVETLAAAYGCIVKPGGKHLRIAHIESGMIVPIPVHGKTVGEAYIRELKRLFDEIDGMKES